MSFREYLQSIESRNPGKTFGKQVAEDCHVPFAETFGIFVDPRDIYEIAAERSLVIKPEYGCSSRGVIPLRRISDDSWFDLLHDVEVDWDDVLESIDKAENSPRNLQLLQRGHPDFLRGPWIAEQLVTGTEGNIADDVKVFCINGRAVLIGIFRRQYRSDMETISDVAWFSSSFEYLGDAHRNRKHFVNPSMESYVHDVIPHRWGDVLNWSERIARDTGEFFMRVDFFASDNGPVFSELTYKPAGGNVDFRPDIDEWLCSVWKHELDIGNRHGLSICR